MQSLFRRAVTAGLILIGMSAGMPLTPASAASGTTIAGRVLDVDGGLPVPNAVVTLEHGSANAGTAKTSADGAFVFKNEPPGVYNIYVRADGYETSKSEDVFVLANESQVTVQTAIARVSNSFRTIAAVRVAGNVALQTSATINEHINPEVLQDQNYMRAGDALAALPFVNGATSSSIGDDLGLSIRGYNPTETATLLDGHPIGPIGAFGRGYDYQISPFWGISAMNVVYGSGATGLYGAPTMAGAIDFQTINPTRERHFTFTQGFGDFGKTMTGLQATGSAGRLGYALGYGVQGTDGELTGNPVQSNLLIDPSQCDPNSPDAGVPSVKRSDILACSYPVSGAYLLRNAVAKLTYDFGSQTSLTLSAFNQTMNADSTGNGDTDFVTYQEMASSNPTAPATDVQTLPGGASATCNNSYVVLNDSAAGYTCMSADQYNCTFAGPAGGGLGRYHDALQQDYHARITQRVGPTSFIVDGYVDNYNFDNVKGSGSSHHFNDIYRTHGFLMSDEYAAGKHDLSAGVFLEHQQHVGQDAGKGTVYPDLQLTMSNYFLRDAYSPNGRFTAFADIALQRSHDTSTTYLNPRLSFMYRPTTNDVVRITGGRSSSIPDPSLMYGGLQYYAWQSYNPTCGSDMDAIGGGNNPALKPERADDVELAYAHRFNLRTSIQANLYSSYEQNPLIGGIFPLSTVPSADQPSDLTQFVAKLQAHCGANFSQSHFGVTEMFNGGSARYRGFDVSTKIGLARNFDMDAQYAVQSAAYYGMPDNILSQDPSLINGAQVWGVPLHRAGLGIDYSNASGLDARLDGYYVGVPNGFNRTPYAYANFNVSKSFRQGLTLNLGVNNVFNSAASQYGYIGLGMFRPQNQFGDPAATALSEGSELFGLPQRQIWLTVTRKI